MNAINIPFFIFLRVINGYYPVVWLVLGIIFCIIRIEAEKTFVIMLEAIKRFAAVLLYAALSVLVASGKMTWFAGDILQIIIDIAFLIVMAVTVLRFKCRLPVKIISAVLFFLSPLLEVIYAVCLYSGVSLPWLWGLTPWLWEFYHWLEMAAALIFIFGAKRIKSSDVHLQ